MQSERRRVIIFGRQLKSPTSYKLHVIVRHYALSLPHFLTQQEAGAHPVTGIIVLVLAVIQPIMALFRPHPGEAKYVSFTDRLVLLRTEPALTPRFTYEVAKQHDVTDYDMVRKCSYNFF